MKVITAKIANIIITNKNIRLIKKVVDKINISQVDYHMLIKGLEKFG